MSGMEERDPFEDIFDDDAIEEETEVDIDDEDGGTETAGGDPEDNDTDPEDGDITDPEGTNEGFTPEMMARIEAEAQRKADEAIARQFEGKIDPYTGRPIRTVADLNAYQAAYNADLQRQQLQDMGIDPSQLNEIIGSMPVMQQAQRIIAQQQQDQANAMMQSEFDALKQEYPDCGFADVASMLADPEGKKVLEFWKDSPKLKIADAYMILNKEKIMSQKTAAAKQGAMNQMHGKKHLSQTKGSNGKGEVPADVFAEYRKFFPEKSASEIAEMYRKNRENNE